MWQNAVVVARLPVWLWFASEFLNLAQGRTHMLFVVMVEKDQANLAGLFSDGLRKVAEDSSGLVPDTKVIELDRDQEGDWNLTLCDNLPGNDSRSSASAVVDLSSGGWSGAAVKVGVPVIRVQTSQVQNFIMSAEDLLLSQEASDAVLVFRSAPDMKEGLRYLVGTSSLWTVATHLEDPNWLVKLGRMVPRPSNLVLFSDHTTLSNLAKEGNLSHEATSTKAIVVVLLDSDIAQFQQTAPFKLGPKLLVIKVDPDKALNRMKGSDLNCTCKGSLKDDSYLQTFLEQSSAIIASFLELWAKQGRPVPSPACGKAPGPSQALAEFAQALQKYVKKGNTSYSVGFDQSGVPILGPPLTMTITFENETTQQSVQLGTWSPGAGFQPENSSQSPVKPKMRLRIGMVLSKPWSWILNAPDVTNSKYLDPSKPNLGLIGYCVDFLKEVAARAGFEYEIYVNPKNTYGRVFPNGSWVGLVDDLISGKVDIAFAPLSVTMKRQEVIDYVTPYFEQSGISIIMKIEKPDTSIFRFMSVLKWDVWCGVLGAVGVVTILIWGLDRFSPYSFRNNPSTHPNGTRAFTLGESLWFTLTSLTPQGGGECPKALSSRVLVTAYWLFIVLVLATFSANLAALLTVERMQTTVQSLNELSAQSKIKYTTSEGSTTHTFFENMAEAEQSLYEQWKRLTLQSDDSRGGPTHNAGRYAVWDYPIREQYGHLLKMMKATGFVASSEMGIQKMIDRDQADYALITDALLVRYSTLELCNFIEVGNPFAEQPVGLGLPKGSQLGNKIGAKVLELQKERFFEGLTAKYFSRKKIPDCLVKDTNGGITLQSLGGIFLATFGGLILALLMLAFELWGQKVCKPARRKTRDTSWTSTSSNSSTTPSSAATISKSWAKPEDGAAAFFYSKDSLANKTILIGGTKVHLSPTSSEFFHRVSRGGTDRRGGPPPVQ